MLNRAARGWVTPVIALLVLALAGDATAGALKTTVRKFCANTSLRIPDGPQSGDFVSRLVKTGKCPPRLLCGYGGLPLGAKVLDVDASVRATHPSVSDLNMLLVNPTGGMTTLTARNAGGADFGGGSASCRGALTTFDDSAPAAIELASPALAPFAGRFRPRQALRGHGGTFGSGDWRFYFDDVVAGSSGTVEAIGIRLRYRYLVRRP
jgi:hypothetical protein